MIKFLLRDVVFLLIMFNLLPKCDTPKSRLQIMLSSLPKCEVSKNRLRVGFDGVFFPTAKTPEKLVRLLEGAQNEYTDLQEFLNDLKKTYLFQRYVAMYIQFKYVCHKEFRYDLTCPTYHTHVDHQDELKYSGVFNDGAILELLQKLKTFMLAPYTQTYDSTGKPSVHFLYTDNVTFKCISHFHIDVYNKFKS
jgi:hypothetical protein